MFALVYAGDMVMFAESINEIQRDLSLDVQKKKTKPVIFRNGDKLKSAEKLNLNGQLLS